MFKTTMNEMITTNIITHLSTNQHESEETSKKTQIEIVGVLANFLTTWRPWLSDIQGHTCAKNAPPSKNLEASSNCLRFAFCVTRFIQKNGTYWPSQFLEFLHLFRSLSTPPQTSTKNQHVLMRHT